MYEKTTCEVREEESKYSRNRREYLKVVGASVTAFTGGLAFSDTASATPTNTGSVSGAGYSRTDRDDYVEVTVEQGGEWICSLGDGDTLSNYLIDISASKANAQINPTGSGWSVMNVGFRGQSDDVDSYPNKHIVPLVDSGGTGVIRNIYMGDGSVSDSRKGAIWVEPDHAGDLLIKEAYIEGWADNGLYGSGPGNSSAHSTPGAGGTVKVFDSYSGKNQISNFRLGTDGSFLENCVLEGGDHRSFWGYYEDTELRDCDLTGAPIVVGEDAWEKSTKATATATNCRYNVDVIEKTSTNEFNGTSQGSPDTTLPIGVPRNPVMAASQTTLDDFEDGDLSEYNGIPSDFQVQSTTVLEGSYTLKTTGDYTYIGHSSIMTPRGYEYSCRFTIPDKSEPGVELITCAQDSSDPTNAAYWVYPDAEFGVLALGRYNADSDMTVLGTASYNHQEGKEYKLALQLGKDTVKGVLYDGSGSIVAETPATSDTTYTDGTFGFYTRVGDAPCYIDYVTKTRLDSV